MASRLPSATLLECPGAGHMVIMERKDQVNEALADLVEQADNRVSSRKTSWWAS
jgi:pimeloyl-ACP methyl ester carboxylesterase